MTGILFMFFGLFQCAQAAVPVEHLDQSWLVFNASYRTYVPYVPGGESPKVLYYSLKPRKYQYDTLQFMSEKGLCIYFDYRLIYQNNERGARLIKIPIQKLASFVASDSVLLAFYRQGGLDVHRLHAQIVTQGQLFSTSSDVAEFLTVKPRRVDPYSRTLLFTVLSVLVLLVLGKVIFPEGVSFWRLMGSMSAGIGGPLNGLLWVKIIINSICIATFAYFLLTSVWVERQPAEAVGLAATKTGVSYFTILFWTFFMHLLKFGYNYLCANFSNMKHLLQSQNFMFVNLFYVINLVLLPILVLSNVNAEFSAWIAQFSPELIGLYFIIPVLILIVNIIKLSGLRNVYLFSYICTAELLPLIMALKFLT
ncbi:MAG: DUF4271 domain-containing protein [Alphaproteobacteria bacterium]|nr:DUF4271 domain-containing protein [Alphaproteobacteria bacterium]